MANFTVHLNTALITTGLGAAVLLSADHIELNSALWLWFLGTIGGLLPDIDADNSTSLDTLFNLFALSAALFIIRYITADHWVQISFVKLITLPLLVYCLMRFLLRPLFEKITNHRGSCHSLLFLLFIALLTTQITWRLTNTISNPSAIIAWLSGGFLFFGGIIHLLLDEIYSVDLRNIRIKHSFGTALKLADFKNKNVTLLTLVAIIALAYLAPSATETIRTLSNWSKFKF